MHSLRFTAETSLDGLVERDFTVGEVTGALWLFDAFASKEKTLHANAGAHKELPRFEADSAVRFFARHFGRSVTSPA